MRILYGIVGEGMGHAMRSRVVLDHLAHSHQVQAVVSGRAHDYLKARESERLGVKKIWGLTIVYEDNEVRNFHTLFRNLKGAVGGGWPKNVRTYFEIAEAFEPDVVVSDFESWSYLFARSHRIPVISLDNIQVLSRCAHAPDILHGHELDFQLAKAVVKAKLPGCLHYLVTSFFFPPVRKPRTSLYPPVLRPEIVAAVADRGEHLLVYQTSESNTDLPALLRQSGQECRIYGLRRDLKEDLEDGKLLFRPFSESAFIDDLRTARAVVANGGFTLLSEAVYLSKPVLSVPVKKQFEQLLNARYLEKEGYGLGVDQLTSARMGQFLERLSEFEEKLSHYHQDGNRKILGALDELLARAPKEQAEGDWDVD
ncbi:MAG TPA: MJ1255/VC2487 family glycosyltransferase [Anaeromyxobacteraceae bacterium]|nr:MJ1255/VC2487 family glycosyltransferase [Anaeromyxobacteraceae bacterium]